jgi:hypothetical protein
MMKHGLFTVCAFVILATAGCPMSDDTGGGSSEQHSPAGAVYAEEYWGEWVRMDVDETWYISGGAIKINGEVRSKSVSLAKQSERVIEVTEGGQTYNLYASRIANSSFTGTITSFEEVAMSVSASASLPILRAAGWIQTVKTNVEAKVTNKNNGSTQTVQTDGEGKFTVEGVIPGDEYEITTATPEGETPVSVTVRPQGDGDDVGTITVTEGANFKTGIKPANGGDNPYFYANGTEYDFVIEVTNVGTEDCLAATCQLNFEDGLVSASTEKTVIKTIEPGVTKTIPLSLRCGAIGAEEEYVSKKITIAVTDEISGKTWTDSVSVKFYKASTSFYLQTEPSAAAPVYGVVINPYDNRAVPFKKADGEDLPSVTLPWSSLGYLAVFSKATAETEAAYALGVNQPPAYSDSDFGSFLELNRYEPNDTEETAVEVKNGSIMAYLHKNDIDYYHFRPLPPGLPLDESLAWISENVEDGGRYAVILSGNETVTPNKTLSFDGKTVGITLLGGAAEWTVSLGSIGALFTVESGVTLKLGNNITLQGRSNNMFALVTVGSGGALEMKSGSKISGNSATAYSGGGGGVHVNGGTFTMSGGEISGNSASGYSYRGGGVCVASGTFTMSDGEISNNTSLYGDGVYVDDNGTFTMSGGKVSGNSATGSGEGVYVNRGTFTMSGGVISDNSNSGVSVSGGMFAMSGGVISDNSNSGVRVSSDGTFTMSDGEISGNSASPYGGGGVVISNSTFTMSGGEISGNTSGGISGGVMIDGTFTMSGGEISGNSATVRGGGVFVSEIGTFTMSGGEISGNNTSGSGGGVYVDGMIAKQSGGIIYGSNASSSLQNTASGDSAGHAVYVSSSQKRRNSTAGVGVTLDSTKDGAAGGWE